MKILVDHCLDWRLVRHLPGHEVQHTGKLGWGELNNGILLRTAEQAGFSVFVTSDKNLQFQQNIGRFKLAIVVLDVPSNRIEDCIQKCTQLLSCISTLPVGAVTIM